MKVGDSDIYINSKHLQLIWNQTAISVFPIPTIFINLNKYLKFKKYIHAIINIIVKRINYFKHYFNGFIKLSKKKWARRIQVIVAIGKSNSEAIPDTEKKKEIEFINCLNFF